jgi:hypothetical protein
VYQGSNQPNWNNYPKKSDPSRGCLPVNRLTSMQQPRLTGTHGTSVPRQNRKESTSNPEKPSNNQLMNQIRAQNRQLPHKPSTISKRKPTRASGYQGRNQQTAEGNKSDKARQQAQLASTSSSRAPTPPLLRARHRFTRKRKIICSHQYKKKMELLLNT